MEDEGGRLMSRRRWIIWLVLLLAATMAGAEDAGKRETLDPFFVPRPDFYAPEPASSEDEIKAHNLVRQVGIDFKNVFATKENWIIVGAGLGAAWGVSYFDQEVANSQLNAELNGLDDGALDRVFESGEIAGDGYVQAALAVTTYGLGKLFSHDGVADLGRDLVRAQIVAVTITSGIKFAVGRERPDGSSTTSFPSGHTSSSFATATVLQRRYGWRIGAPAYAFAGYVAGSRLNEGRHYLSDVVFGAALGIMSGRTVTLGVGGERFALAPLFVPGGAGVQLAWVGSERR